MISRQRPILQSHVVAIFICLFLLFITGFSTISNVAHASTTDIVDTSKWTTLTSNVPTYFAGTKVGQPVKLTQIAYGAGRWIAISDANDMIQSTDGFHWSTLNSQLLPNYITYAGSQWVAINNLGISTSNDGVTWPTFPPQTNNDAFFYSIAYDGSSYVAVGEETTGTSSHAAVFQSTNAKTWRDISPYNINSTLYKVIYGNGVYVASDESGQLYYSLYVYGWQPAQNDPNVNPIYDVAYGNGTFVGVGLSGGIYTSTDGQSWEKESLPSGVNSSIQLNAITFGGNKFVAVGDGGTILSSIDGKVWTEEASSTSQNLGSVAYGAGQFIAVGDAGTIVATSNANLSNLTLNSSGSVAFSPAYSIETTSYTATVLSATESIDVTPTLADPNATVKVNENLSTSGTPVTVPLTIGNNVIQIKVTSKDGAATKVYTVIVTRPSNIADLQTLGLSSGALQPAFATGTTDYTTNVTNDITSIDITPTSSESHATIKVNGNVITSGQSVNIPLIVGENTITVLVTAQDGTIKTYTIKVTRAASGNTDLNNLTIDSGILQPTFSSQTTDYSVKVDQTVTSVKITATAADNTSKLMINGNNWSNGNAFNETLNTGDNLVNIEVIAQNGTAKTYKVTVSQEASYTPSKADLKSLSISQGTLSPSFASYTTDYTATVSNTVDSLDVSPTVADPTATVTVNGKAVDGGSAANVVLLVGKNEVTIAVTAQDGTTKTYSITVTRQSAVSSSFTIQNGSISNKGGIKATVTVAPNVGTIPSGTQTVLFELMNGTTPESIVAIETSIQSSKQVSAYFNVIGTNYSVKAFVFDTFSADPTNLGNSLADPVVLTQ